MNTKSYQKRISIFLVLFFWDQMCFENHFVLAQEIQEKKTSGAAAMGSLFPQLRPSAPSPSAFENTGSNKSFTLSKPGIFQGSPSAFISLGADQSTFAIVVEKNFHRLSVFQLYAQGSYRLVKTYRAITGKERGDKKHRGDNRTPEGIYFIVGHQEGSDLVRIWGDQARKYGPRAFVLDYPNIFDKMERKTGSGIWIHGVDSDSRMDKLFDTEGCVALNNEDILDLEQYVSRFQTPVLIVDEMQISTAEALKVQKKEIVHMIEQWRKSWESSDFATYLGFYSEHFSSLGKNKRNWFSFKARLAERRTGSIRVQLSSPRILSFKNQLLVEFLQRYSSPEKVDFGRKFLYLGKEEGKFKIIAEKWYHLAPEKSEIAVLNETPQARRD